MNRLITIFIFVLMASKATAQDPMFSQYYVNGIYVNPAMNAINDYTKVSMQYRNQWTGNSYNYSTYNAALELPINNTNSSFGAIATSDETRSALLNHTSFSLVYAYKFKLNEKWMAQTALQAGIGQNRLENDLIFEDQLSLEGPTAEHSAENFASENLVYPDFSSGIMLFSKDYYFGAAIHHLNRPNQAFRDSYTRRLERKYTFNGGAKFSKDKLGRVNQYYSPNFIVQIQGNSSSISLGNYFKYHSLTAGLWYRWKDAMVIGLGFELDNFRFAYSADFNIGNNPASALSHEVSIGILFTQKSKGHNQNYYNKALSFCPTF